MMAVVAAAAADDQLASDEAALETTTTGLDPRRISLIASSGYYVTNPFDLTDDDLSYFIAFGESLNYGSMFENVAGKQDPLRQQGDFNWTKTNRAKLYKLYGLINLEAQKISPDLEIKGASSFIRSSAGCKPQEPHPDMEIARVAREITETGVAPFLMMIALMDGATLKIFPKSCGGQENEVVNRSHNRKIELKAKQALLFRGDLVHCGVGYSKVNWRMHITLGSRRLRPLRLVNNNRWFGVTFKVFHCPSSGCSARLGSTDSLGKHLRDSCCKVTAEALEERRKRKEARLQALEIRVYCPLCSRGQQPFREPDKFRAHMKKKHELSVAEAMAMVTS